MHTLVFILAFKFTKSIPFIFFHRQDIISEYLYVSEALTILKFTPNRSARYVEKTLKSALANAEHNLGLDMDKLFVVRATADQGAYMRRFRPVSHGRAHAFRHHTSHITVAVAEK